MPRFLVCFIAVIVAATSAIPAAAQQDGSLVGLHDLRREGRSICLIGHYHLGTSYGQRTKKLAKRAAMRDWSGFTAWEYGGHWGSPRRAKNKSMACKQTGSGWACDFNARPCKPARSRTARR